MKDTGKTIAGDTGKDKQGGLNGATSSSYSTTKYGVGGIPGHPGLNGLVIMAWATPLCCAFTHPMPCCSF